MEYARFFKQNQTPGLGLNKTNRSRNFCQILTTFCMANRRQCCQEEEEEEDEDEGKGEEADGKEEQGEWGGNLKMQLPANYWQLSGAISLTRSRRSF